ncbi:MAG: PqqD family protein [Clostridia bacterium]|nr:PqqD family protein [Clostridia bacterium]
MKKENYLERKPCRRPDIRWTTDEEGVVTLEIENKGVFNRVAQKLLKKPKITYIHLDKMGSFIWPLIDGKTDIIALGEKVEAYFGEEAHPLYERLSEYIRILESYTFVQFN